MLEGGRSANRRGAWVTAPRYRTGSRKMGDAFPALQARVAKLADATDLKSVGPQGPCGFEPRPGHHVKAATPRKAPAVSNAAPRHPVLQHAWTSM